jgi:hypothetical protein
MHATMNLKPVRSLVKSNRRKQILLNSFACPFPFHRMYCIHTDTKNVFTLYVRTVHCDIIIWSYNADQQVEDIVKN